MEECAYLTQETVLGKYLERYKIFVSGTWYPLQAE